MKPSEIKFLNRIVVQEYLSNLWGHLLDQKSMYDVILERKPGDIEAMLAIKRIENDLVILNPLVVNIQKENLTEIEKMTGNKFAFLLPNKDINKDILTTV